jgi:hypothetical protein
MGSMPYRMYDVCIKKTSGLLGLVDKTSPAFELRNSDVPAVVRGHAFQLSNTAWILKEHARVFLGCRALVTAYHWHPTAAASRV